MAKHNGDTALSQVQEMMLQPLDVNNGDVDGESALMRREEFLVQESTEIVDEEPCLSQQVQQVEAISERRQGNIISEFVGEVGKSKAQAAQAAGGRKMEEGEKLHSVTVNQIVALESENLQLTNELHAFHLQLETAAQERIEFFTEIENLKAQTRMIGDEREHLLSVVEASESRADQLATEIVRCKKQVLQTKLLANQNLCLMLHFLFCGICSAAILQVLKQHGVLLVTIEGCKY